MLIFAILAILPANRVESAVSGRAGAGLVLNPQRSPSKLAAGAAPRTLHRTILARLGVDYEWDLTQKVPFGPYVDFYLQLPVALGVGNEEILASFLFGAGIRIPTGRTGMSGIRIEAAQGFLVDFLLGDFKVEASDTSPIYQKLHMGYAVRAMMGPEFTVFDRVTFSPYGGLMMVLVGFRSTHWTNEWRFLRRYPSMIEVGVLFRALPAP